MSQILKPYEELVIASDRRIFLKVRLRLTAVYVAVIFCILLGYNTLNYLDLKHDLIEAGSHIETDKELTDVPGHAKTLPLLIDQIVVEDIIILSIAAWISYIFAGHTLKPVQRSLIVQKNFSENASHELRTPLAVIKSDAEVLLRNKNPTEEVIKATLESIVEEIDRMTIMTNDLLLLARSEHQNVVQQKSINIVNLAETMVRKMTTLADKKGININFVTHFASFVINGDIMALDRVFLNLLQNAITYTPENGSITVELQKDGGNVVIGVRDIGKGITTKDLPHVFERFYKGEGSKGIGLGLPIVKEIIENHKGNITIRSEVGVGTEVILRIPCLYIG